MNCPTSQKPYGMLMLLRAHKLTAFTILLLFFLPTITFSQTLSIKGKITDDAGIPVPGVTIQEKGTAAAAVTDAAGNYMLTVQPNATLLISHIGYLTQTIQAGSRSVINVSLAPEATGMADVVVIGYQTVRRKDLTGATGVVKMEDATKISTGSVAEQLQGLVPGVTVRNGGAPGQNAAIEIRGVGSFGNANPLYVIDGMIADANVTINPDDIASVQILKDASASAIYGSRAGNGVILITTKKGKSGEPRVTASAKYGIQQLHKTWDMMSAPQYLQTVKQEYANSAVALPADVTAQLNNNTINTDWQKATYQQAAYQDYNASISGGSGGGNYYLSGGYYSNEGTVAGNGFNRGSMRLNTEVKKGIVTVGENMLLSLSNGKYPGGGVNAFYNSAQMLPTIMVQGDQYKDANLYPANPGGWGLGSSNNPTYANNYLANVALDKVNFSYAKIVGNAYLGVKLTPWLDYKFNVGLETSFDYTKEVRDTGVWRYTNQPPQTFVSEGRSRYVNFLMEHTLNFNKTFGLHAINGVAGFSRADQGRDYTNASKNLLQDVNGNLFTTIGSALGAPAASGGLNNKWRNHGWLGRVNYAYADKYLLTVSGRIDQDSRFGPNYRTGYFPSAALGWRISKEDFFNVDWIKDLKLRGSYGKLGFSDVLTAWQYIGYLNTDPRAIYGTGQTPQVGAYQAVITNPNLRWETRLQTNVGADAQLFNNALAVSVDWYRSLSKDVLVLVPLPQYLGSAGSPYVNTGSIRNTGIEMAVTYKNYNHALKWDVSGNFTTIKNKVLSVGNQGVDVNGHAIDYLEPANFVRSQVGHAMASWYVIKTDGIFQNQGEIDAYKNKAGTIIQPNAKPGDIRYVDANGDGLINDQDRTFAGSPWPSLQTGLQFNASYKNFSLNMQLVGVFGNKIYDDVRRAIDNYQLTNFRKDINPWSPTNPGGTDPRLAVDNGNDPTVSVNNMGETNRWLENGSYVRLRNLEIGYSLPAAWTSKIKFHTARVFISAQNLLTITKYKGLDPDISNSNLGMRGLDSGFWPSSRIFSAGVNIDL
ncbi:SusC/RagA family TonB-linked outer membrane protein [Niastella koreensis]|uniref:TonB-dependent receptor n=2 Tax=Niastella koreensis TaxID=354356 RepID=G8TLT1_NIAKG|nr:TonB-dependent receptor [Niastella koreensis]AEV97673.1 TonB-dependent receptor [Niastella koreensis GR20-10]OQP40504.1 SusC/RagA family TonB-linked outer membrane protein [Niastella koreensis]